MTLPTDKTSALFIDEHVEIHEGTKAAELLRDRSARQVAAFQEEKGIVEVDQGRWEEAQRFERRTWLERNPFAASDRNEYHRSHFADYTPLDGMHFKRVVEFGCGPFTNMRLILEHCQADEVHLLDPLLRDYRSHPFCQYRGGRLGGLVRNLPPITSARHPRELLRNRAHAFGVGGVLGRPVTLHTSMIETFESHQRFDLLVMINVIEHCRSIDEVFGKVLETLEPDGIFVFADKLFDAQEVKGLAERVYDAGHPLRVDRGVITGFLGTHFDLLMQAEYDAGQQLGGAWFQNNELYYIGRRRSHP